MAQEGKLILVTGATGHQGGAAMRHLRAKSFAVRALTRDPDRPEARALVGHGAEVVRGDLDDLASVARKPWRASTACFQFRIRVPARRPRSGRA
jgi:nucleoside-diphosphate-sugar epimerase